MHVSDTGFINKAHLHCTRYQKLKHVDWEVRQAVVETLSNLEPEMLVDCSDEISAKLREPNEVALVHEKVVRVLGKLSPERLMEHSADIIATYESDDGRVRKAAIETRTRRR